MILLVFLAGYYWVDPFQTNVSFLKPLKTTENLWFSEGIKIEHWLEMGCLIRSEKFQLFSIILTVPKVKKISSVSQPQWQTSSQPPIYKKILFFFFFGRISNIFWFTLIFGNLAGVKIKFSFLLFFGSEKYCQEKTSFCVKYCHQNMYQGFAHWTRDLLQIPLLLIRVFKRIN